MRRPAAAADRPACQPDGEELTRVGAPQPRRADEVATTPASMTTSLHRERGGDVPQDSTTSAAVPIASAAEGPASQRQADREVQGQKRRSAVLPPPGVDGRSRLTPRERKPPPTSGPTLHS